MTSTPLPFGQQQKLTSRLRELVSEYPRGVGIFKEVLQNADDAGASKLDLFLDHRSFEKTGLPNSAMGSLLGRAMVFVNDTAFSENDWAKIQDIANSGKVLDTAKTGRFGLGFNCVYNVTDFPMLLTRDQLGIFDPHAETVESATLDKPGAAWRLSELWEDYPNLLAPFMEFGLTEGQEYFDGTVFRLPLRNQATARRSDICQQPFSTGDYRDVVKSVQQHSGELLLFLNSVRQFSISEINARGKTKQTLRVSTVNSSEIELVQQELRKELGQPTDTLLEMAPLFDDQTWFGKHEIAVQVGDDKSKEVWWKVRGLYSNNELIESAIAMGKLQKKAIPLAGAAVRIDSTRPVGGLSCSLPLPTDSNTPLNIDGYFDIYSNRQDIFQDIGATGVGKARCEWNQLLLEHGCAVAAAELLEKVAKETGTPIYPKWPTVPSGVSEVHERKRFVHELPKYIYSALKTRDCIAVNDEFDLVVPSDAKVANKQISKLLLGEEISIANPTPPSHVIKGMASVENEIPRLTQKNVRDLLRDSNFVDCELVDAKRKCLQNRDSVLALLEFCLSDNDPHDFEDIPLALMSDELLRKFDSFEAKALFLGSEQELALLGGVVDLFLHDDVVALDVELLPNVRSIAIDDVIREAAELYRSVGEGGFVEYDSSADDIPTYEWLSRFFEYCSESVKTQRLSSLPEEELLQALPLVPDNSGRLWGMCLDKTPVFIPKTQRRPWLVDLLTSAGKEVVADADSPGREISKFRAAIGSDHEIESVTPEKLVEFAADDADTYEALITADSITNESFLDYVSTSHAGSLSTFAQQLANLDVFPVKGGGFTSIKSGVYQSSGFQAPDISAEFTILDDGDGRWSKLYALLTVEKLTQTSFATDFVLEDFSSIEPDHQFAALEWLRLNYQLVLAEFTDKAVAAEFKRKLRSAKIIRGEDGELRAAKDLYHPDCKDLVQLLGSAANFPDQELFFDEDWLQFLGNLGMVRNVRSRDILKAIDDLIESDYSLSVVNQLGKIAKFIADSWDSLYVDSVLGDWFAKGLASRAWLPAISKCPSSVPAKLYKLPSSSFFKPAEIARRCDLDLVCSELPVCIFAIEGAVGKAIGHVGAAEETVLAHFDNLIEALDSKKSANKFEVRMLEKVYQYIGRALSKPNPEITAQNLYAEYHNAYCLIDHGNRVWAPIDTFEIPVPYFLNKRRFIKFAGDNEERCLSALGRKTAPTPDDFREFLDELADDLDGKVVENSQQSEIRQTIRAAAKAASANELAGSVVLSEEGFLCKSNELLFFDAPWLEKRVLDSEIELVDRELGPSVAVAFGVGMVSKVVSERITDHEVSTAEDLLSICQQLNETIESIEFVNGMLRLLPDKFKAEDVIRRFQNFEIVAATKISTELFRGEDAVENSLGQSSFVFEKGRVYVASLKEAILRVKVAKTIAEQIFSGITVSDLNISMMFSDNPSNIESLLDQLHVSKLPPERAVKVPEADESKIRESQQLLSEDFDSEDLVAEAVAGSRETTGIPSSAPKRKPIAAQTSLAGSSNSTSASGRTEKDFPTTRRGKGNGQRTGTRTPTGRAISYLGGGEVTGSVSSLGVESPSPTIGSAIAFVLKEENLVRSSKPTERSREIHIESTSKDSDEVERQITVIGLPGAWNDAGIRLTPKQMAFGQKNGDSHWLYVVEFSNEPSRARIHAFQNPVKLITEYRMDAGWTEFATETLGVGIVSPVEGGRVAINGAGEGEIVSIKTFKEFKKLKIRLDNDETMEVKFPHHTVEILEQRN